ncbi:MAG: LytTR family DNA-binding domain-containing protein [Eubacteriales bacterium]|nr:LytTR family DNA-binding domain-containing protein [Eubacteriales bacterium]
MKIEINVDEKIEDVKISIDCPRLTPDIEKLLSMIRMLDMQIAVKKDGEIYMLDATTILYIEAVERVTFLYTQDCVYESELKLYELEQQLCERGFFRVSKSCLIQLKKIKSMKADLNRKIKVTMQGGDQIMVSRMYADELRKRLGVK